MLRRARWCHGKSSVRPSVCLSVSVTFRYRHHIGWNSSKIISRPNSSRLMRRLIKTCAICSNGNTPKLGWNRGGVRSTKTCNISETAQDDQGYLSKFTAASRGSPCESTAFLFTSGVFWFLFRTRLQIIFGSNFSYRSPLQKYHCFLVADEYFCQNHKHARHFIA